MSRDRKSRILLVDDDPIGVFVVREMLAEKYILDSASSADEAFRIAETTKPDLILIDLVMQGENGYDLCRRFKNSPKLGFTKIILISPKSLLKDRLYGYNAGADDYLAKPFDPDELMAKLNVFIRLKSVEEIDRVKDDLINVFSHETRTPLNAIIGFSKILLESESLPEEEKEYAKIIADSGVSLLSLSNKAIMLSSLRKSSFEHCPVKIKLSRLVSDVMKTVSASFAAKNITPEINVPDDITINADEKLAGTAISFVAENAFKFSPAGTKVWISAARNDEGSVSMFVRDSGKGIEQSRISDLFDEFGVGDVAHHGRGHGLSLSIVKAVMDCHGGSVSASNSTEAPGAVFELRFPKQPVAV